ncbi:hypothetical protein [Jannaschia sp. R86511]|uniref:hypothetical protein n=1 Tax=Jannaschia sp. R86511 TaxID=3093853 RepID=UPI0036D32CA8
MTGAATTPTHYHCTACGHEPTDDPRSGGALRHCEVCGSWVAAPATLGRDLVLPHLVPA